MSATLLKPYFSLGEVEIYFGNCQAVLPQLPSSSVDIVVSDPPYPGIKRDYGYWTEDEWHTLMHTVVAEVRRILKPSGSAVFILQPNGEHIGRMRPWLWDFMGWACREWNMVQDMWWWNITAMPTQHSQRRHGLLRPSLKVCLWLGAPDCYRNQEAVLWEPSEEVRSGRLAARADNGRGRINYPSGHSIDREAVVSAIAERGGVTPFNVLPLANTTQRDGHSAATPLALCQWWIQYASPKYGVVLDPFAGSGSTLLAATYNGRKAIGIEQHEHYVLSAAERVEESIANQALNRREQGK